MIVKMITVPITGESVDSLPSIFNVKQLMFLIFLEGCLQFLPCFFHIVRLFVKK